MKKRLLTLFTAMAMVVCMTACGSSFDASGYVKGYLDANFKGEFDAYAKLCDKETSEVEDTYNETLDEVLNGYLTGITLSEDTTAQLKEAFISVFKQTKYSVDEAKKDGDKYTVSVTVEPLYLGMTTESMTKLSEEAAKKYAEENPDAASYDTDKLYAILGELLVDFLNEKAENPIYGESSTIDVIVYPNEDKQYTISTEDQTALATGIFTNEEVAGATE